MRGLAAAFLLMVVPCAATSAEKDKGSLVDRLNEALKVEGKQQNTSPTAPTAPKWSAFEALPQWGVVVLDRTGSVVDFFGEVPYEVTKTGAVVIPGFDQPKDTHLEIVSATEAAAKIQENTKIGIGAMFQPIANIPSSVVTATDFLAKELCAKKGRPTELTLNLVVSASGSIFFATAGTEAGSEVNWNFQDVCGRYGLEGDGIPFQ